MKITDFNFECPMLTSIYCERYINDTKGRFEDYSEVNKLFDPQGNVTEFQIPFTWINELELEIFQSSPSCKILNNIRRGDTYKFFWHPDTSRMDLSVDGYAIMQPTSSTRTMLEMQKLEYYVKTDLDKKHFRFIRRLKGDSVKHSIDICNDLRELTSWLPQSSTYSFLPESIGLIIKNGIHKRSGVIYREAKPFPESTGKKVMIPYHSLYADDMKDPDTPPILIQLCEIHANQSPLNFFLEYIIGFVQNAWVMLVTKRGLLPELHGQNALLEIDELVQPPISWTVFSFKLV